MSFLLGVDVGSSSVKASIVDSETGKCVASATSPDTELAIEAAKSGWAEQDPRTWWEHVVRATRMLKRQNPVACAGIEAIGISYQMHGLVTLDSKYEVVRPAIIWCDSRAVDLGKSAFQKLGESTCLTKLHNSPGNFTASKLAWVKENEPQNFARIKHACLPGDYIGLRLTGELRTTITGLSEGILWNFEESKLASFVLEHFGISPTLFPQYSESFTIHGKVTAQAAEELGIQPWIPVSYRAGDQPNNAFSLGVLEPGELATTAGTSGVVYAVSEGIAPDKQQRVNTFVHVNHTAEQKRCGTLLCVNGTGILFSFIRREFCGGANYDDLNKLAEEVAPGSDGLIMFPYGNGAERSLGNLNLGASISGLSLTWHKRAHVVRAAKEGIVYALNYGISALKELGVPLKTVRAGRANLFLSPAFRQIFCDVTGLRLELVETDGAAGAARGAGVGAGTYRNAKEAQHGLKVLLECAPIQSNVDRYQELYKSWQQQLTNRIKSLS